MTAGALRHIIFSILILIVAGQTVRSQDRPYRSVDSIMRNYREKIKGSDDLYKVVYFIRSNFKEDSIRLRASFIWITDNIDYDVRAYLAGDPSAAQLPYVLKKKKAICSGYASLLKFFCDAFGIENSIVEGYARTGKKSVVLRQDMLRVNHAWNTVKINNAWRLIDATWAAGVMDEEDEEDPKYKKQFNELYYFTPPDRLIFNHMPINGKYQYLTKLIAEPAFKKQPLFLSAFLADSIRKVFPDSSLIKTRIGDTLLFRFNTVAKEGRFCIFSPSMAKAAFNDRIKSNGDWLECRYPVLVRGYYIIYIGYCSYGVTIPLAAYRLEVN